MLPFKVYDRSQKITWIILNYHPAQEGGVYLAAREDDTSQDGELTFLPEKQMANYKLVGFVEEQD